MGEYKRAIMELVGRLQSERALERLYKLALYLYTREERKL